MRKIRKLQKIMNAFRYHKAISNISEYSSQYPVDICVETTAICNLKCNKCPVGRERIVEPKYYFMDLRLFRRIIDEVRGHVFSVDLTGFGEPLINPNLFGYVDYAKRNDLGVSFFSNATALNDEAIKNIIRYNVDYITFSIDSLPDASSVYGFLKNIPDHEAEDHLKTVISNIENLIRAIRKKDAITDVYVTRFDMPGTTPLPVYKKFWEKIGVRVHSGGLHNWAGTVERVNSNNIKGKKQCVAPYKLQIYSDGKVPLCCIDYNCKYMIGNVSSQSIESIYNGEKIRAVRKKIARHDYKGLICEQCSAPFILHTSNPITFVMHIYLSSINSGKKALKFLHRILR